MQDILAVTGPIYIILVLGYLSTRWGLFVRADMRVFGKFVINIALPALLFNALSQRPVADILHPGFVAAYALGSLLVMGVGIFWARRLQRKSIAASAFVGMGMSCPNSGFIGFPLVLQLLGPVAGVALALAMVVENLLLLPLALALADSDPGESGRAGRWRDTVVQSLKGLLTNPMILGIAAGFVFALFGWHLPEPLARTVNLLATSCGALALFVIGGSLSGLAVHAMWRDVGAITLGKLVLHPLAVLAFVLLLPPMDPVLRTALIVFSAVPMLGIYAVLAQKHQQDEMAAGAQIVTTLASFFTLNLLLWALGRAGS